MRFTHHNPRHLRFEFLESRELLSVSHQVDSWAAPVVLGDAVIFVASDPEHGKELWITDGTESGTNFLKDIYPGTNDSNPSQLTLCGNVVYFTARTAANGTELWKTDGTANGTVMVKDIYFDVASSNPDKLTAVGTTLYFIAETAVNGTELWKSDGTANGTTMVRDVWSGSDSGCGWSSELCAVGNTLFFSAQTEDGDYELWKSDGTTSGTTRVKDIRSGKVGSYPAEMIAVDTTLYFTADDGTAGTELWKSDGTTSGTTLVKDIRSGSSSSTPTGLTLLGDTLYFTANNGTNGTELWKSDGTTSGTTLVKDIYAGSNGSNPTGLTVYGNSIFFTANDDTNGTELWKTDGTANGTTLVKDIRAGSNSSNPGSLTVVGNTLFFTANNGTNGAELWKSNGTTNGTMIVKDIRTGNTGSNPFHLTPYKGKLLFAANDDYDNAQLFLSDGTATGTNRILPFTPVPTAIIDTTDLSVQQGGSLLLSATASMDPLGKGLVYLWDLQGRGVFRETTEPTILFSTEGVGTKGNAFHLVSLKVRDTDGNESPVTQVGIYVRYVTPNYTVKCPESELYAKTNAVWEFTVTDYGRQGIMSWIIDWGDGTTKTEILGGPRNQVEVRHGFANPGKYGITVTNTDSGGVTTTVFLGSYSVSSENMNSGNIQTASVAAFDATEILATSDVVSHQSPQEETFDDTGIYRTNIESIENRSLWFEILSPDDDAQRQTLDLDERSIRKKNDTLTIDYLWKTEEAFEYSTDFDVDEEDDSVFSWQVADSFRLLDVFLADHHV